MESTRNDDDDVMPHAAASETPISQYEPRPIHVLELYDRRRDDVTGDDVTAPVKMYQPYKGSVAFRCQCTYMSIGVPDDVIAFSNVTEV